MHTRVCVHPAALPDVALLNEAPQAGAMAALWMPPVSSVDEVSTASTVGD